jgi:hypothetical protein
VFEFALQAAQLDRLNSIVCSRSRAVLPSTARFAWVLAAVCSGTVDLIPYLDDPEQLEHLYRAAPQAFERALSELDAVHSKHALVRAWRARLAPGIVTEPAANHTSWANVALVAIATAIVARLVYLEGKNEGLERLARFAPFVVILPVTWLLARRRELRRRDAIFLTLAIAALAAASFTPFAHSQSGVLSFVHQPFLLIVLVFAALASDLSSQRAEFVSLVAEIAIFSLAILFGGALLTGLTVGVFRLIKLDVADFYLNNVVIAGVAAAPVLATGLERTRSGRGDRLAPALARIFSPLALLTLLAYAIAIAGTRNNPYQDRESLAVLYAMLLATALLVTLMSLPSGERQPSRHLLLLACAIAGLSIAVDGLALSAIIYRFRSFGMSPNRLAVLGGNLLLFGYLGGLTLTLARAARSGANTQLPMRWVAAYIPLFGIWAGLWVFVFPILFGFV